MKVCGQCGQLWPEGNRFCPTDGTELADRLPADPLSQLIGRTLNRTYKIESKLGQGGTGAVFKARHLGIGDAVAIKVIMQEHTQNPETLARFRREAQAARRLAHPNAVAVHDFNITEDGLVFMVMEYVNGETVEKHLEKYAPLTPQRALEILKPVAAALDIAHSLGIIHRDLKPANLMLCRDSSGQEQVKVLDFGTARIANTADMGAITRKGQVFGTPLYMSPELVLCEPTSSATDIYSLGVILYQMLTGSVPFMTPKTLQTMMAHVHQAPEPPSQRYSPLTRDFDPVVLKALEKAPADRYATAGELIDQFSMAMRASSGEKVPEAKPFNIKDLLPPELRPSTGSSRKKIAFQSPNFDCYIGRDIEFKRLQEEYENALEGKARPTFIFGSPGTGKTQLTNIFREWLEAQGAYTLTGKFFDYGGSATEPMQLFRKMLQGAITARPSGQLLNTEQMNRLFETGLPPQEKASENDKWQLFENFTTTLALIAQARPLVMILDDLQWADTLSLEFLGYLLRNTDQRQFLFIGAARAEEANSKGHPFREWFVAQTRYLYYEKIELTAFDHQTIYQLLEAIFKLIEIRPQEIELLHSITDGNPFYLCEVIRLLYESKKIWFQDGLWRGESFDAVKLPDSISNIVRYKLENCPEDLRGLLAYASVIGDDFRFELLQEVSQMDESKLERLLAAGVKSFLLCEEGNALGDDYRFYHTTIRRVIYDSLPQRQRARLHGRVAEALVKENRTKVQDAALAYHYHAAGEWKKTFQHAVSATEQAFRKQSMDELLRLTKFAEEAVEHLADSDGHKDRQLILADMKLKRATGLMRLGRFGEVEREIDEMAPFIDSLGVRSLQARRYPILAELCYWSSRYAEGVKLGLAGLKLAREAEDEECIRRVMYYLAWCQARSSNLVESLPIFQQVSELSEQAGDPSLQAGALIAYGELSHFPGEWRKARNCMQKALELTRSCNDRHLECLAMVFAGWMREYEGKHEELQKYYQDGLRLARSHGWRNWEGYLHFIAGRQQLRQAEPDLGLAEELLTHSMAIMQEAHDISGQTIVAPALALVAALDDLNEHTVNHLRSTINHSIKYGEVVNSCEVMCDLGAVEQRLGRWENALASYETALKIATLIPHLDCQWRCHYGMAQCRLHFVDESGAIEHITRAVSIIKNLQKELDRPEEVTLFLADKQPVFDIFDKLTN